MTPPVGHNLKDKLVTCLKSVRISFPGFVRGIGQRRIVHQDISPKDTAYPWAAQIPQIV